MTRSGQPDDRDGRDLPPLIPDRRAHRPGNRVRRFFLDLLDRLHRWADSGWAPEAVAAWGAMQGSVFPGPADALLIPLGIADPKKVGRLAVAALLGSTTGGLIAFAIGKFAFDEVGLPLLHFMRIEDATIASSKALFDRRGWLIVLTAAVTPIPMKLVCIAAGAFGVPVLPFIAGLVGGRGLRFAVIAFGVRMAGERVQRWAEGLRERREARADARGDTRAFPRDEPPAPMPE